VYFTATCALGEAESQRSMFQEREPAHRRAAYPQTSTLSHGFLRYRDGRIETFDAPGAGTGPNQGTFAEFNNPANAIVGYYLDASGTFHGFLRTPPER